MLSAVHQHWHRAHRDLGPWDNVRLCSPLLSGLRAGVQQTVQNIDLALLSSSNHKRYHRPLYRGSAAWLTPRRPLWHLLIQSFLPSTHPLFWGPPSPWGSFSENCTAPHCFRDSKNAPCQPTDNDNMRENGKESTIPRVRRRKGGKRRQTRERTRSGAFSTQV